MFGVLRLLRLVHQAVMGLLLPHEARGVKAPTASIVSEICINSCFSLMGHRAQRLPHSTLKHKLELAIQR